MWPQGWRQKIDGWWALYQKADPGWPAAKEEWLALSSPAPTILVENLLRAYVLAWEGSQRMWRGGAFPIGNRKVQHILSHSASPTRCRNRNSTS